VRPRSRAPEKLTANSVPCMAVFEQQVLPSSANDHFQVSASQLAISAVLPLAKRTAAVSLFANWRTERNRRG
jgi:hypothetical protein